MRRQWLLLLTTVLGMGRLGPALLVWGRRWMSGQGLATASLLPSPKSERSPLSPACRSTAAAVLGARRARPNISSMTCACAALNYIVASCHLSCLLEALCTADV